MSDKKPKPKYQGLHVHRTGHWLPQDHAVVERWIGGLLERIDKNRTDDLLADLNPVLQEFQALVDGDKTLEILVSLMFIEVPNKPPYNQDPTGQPQVRDFNTMLRLINEIMLTAPAWSDIADEVGLIGFPINAIMDWPMGTASGNAFFLRKDVNEVWKRVLDEWAVYLGSTASAEVLNDGPEGWFGPNALNALTVKGNNGTTDLTFAQLYECTPEAQYYGFKTWDDFFTRLFRPDVRRIAFPDTETDPSGVDPTTVIINACESTPLRLVYNVQATEKFWLKGQPYSLADMLANDERAPTFFEGTVYQAFLSALSYHRWHAPVSGTVVRAYVVPGSYYSENYFEGFANPDPDGPDPIAPNDSQAYISAVATRALIFIQADNRDIGLMAFVGIGMCEVSTCDITVTEGDHVTKGDELGMFHFGGSTHCLVFRKESGVVFQQQPPYDPDAEFNTPVNSFLAVVKPSIPLGEY